MIKYYIPHIVFFSVFCVALVPMLFYYRRRQPHARFRPGAGEVTLIAVIALMIGGTASYFLGNLFRGDIDPSKFDGRPEEGAGWSRGANAPREDADDSRYQNK